MLVRYLHIITVSIIALPMTFFAQPEWMPSFPETAATVQGYIPDGWSLIDSVSGELDGDGVADLALLLVGEHEIPSSILVRDHGPDTMTATPHVLVVVTGDSSGGFNFLASGSTLMWSDYMNTNGSLRLHISIVDGELILCQYYFTILVRNALRYHFRVQQDGCVLVKSQEEYWFHESSSYDPGSHFDWISSGITTDDFLAQRRVVLTHDEEEIPCEDCAADEDCPAIPDLWLPEGGCCVCTAIPEDWTPEQGRCVRVTETRRTEQLPDLPLLYLEDAPWRDLFTSE